MTTMNDVARNFLHVKRGLVRGHEMGIKKAEKYIANAKTPRTLAKVPDLEKSKAWSEREIVNLTFEIDAVDYLLRRLEDKSLRLGDEDAADIRFEMKRYTGGITGEFQSLPPF